MARTKTPKSKKYDYMVYLTKNLRRDLHDRLRVQAALRGTTIEDIVNISVDAGLVAVEAATSDAAQLRKQIAANDA